MTDEQIVKALDDVAKRVFKLCGLALDLINRQKAEIERLQHYKQSYDELKAEHLETIKAIKQVESEAIKEFIKEHREIMMAFCDDDDQISLKVCEYDANTDNLVKEMVGDSDA